jgi:hypothetical protein
MQPKRFSVKYFVEGDPGFDLAALTPIFHRWIQQHSVEGLLIDVADYKHVFQGPGIVLIGHEADYAFDLKDGRPGLRYVRKQPAAESFAESLQLALRLALAAVRQLESEPELNGVRFNTAEPELIFLDRLQIPNTPASFERVLGDIQAAGSSQYQTKTLQIESVESDSRKPLTIRIVASQESVAK